MKSLRKHAADLWLSTLMVLALLVSSTAQTKVKPGINVFSVTEEIQMGSQAASQYEREMPLVNDPVVQQWISDLGSRLASSTPMPNLPWRFRVADSSDINAAALPGGFVFVNRGLIEATEDESELVGALSHEMAHVTLRHKTNEITKQMLILSPLAELEKTKGKLGLAAKIGIYGMGLVLLKFSRGHERDADILGVQTMARAGYDPRGMIAMFETLQRAGGNGGMPQFLSTHPNPENRIKRIQQEIELIQVNTNPIGSSRLYLQVRKRLRSMPPASRITPGRERE